MHVSYHSEGRTQNFGGGGVWWNNIIIFSVSLWLCSIYFTQKCINHPPQMTISLPLNMPSRGYVLAPLAISLLVIAHQCFRSCPSGFKALGGNGTSHFQWIFKKKSRAEHQRLEDQLNKQTDATTAALDTLLSKEALKSMLFSKHYVWIKYLAYSI